MNGEVAAYKLNSMMTWKEFKAMPDDIKTTYIKLIREKYNTTDKVLAEAFGVHRITVHNEFNRLGLCNGSGKGGKRIWDEEWFKAFCGNCNPAPVEEPVEEVGDEPVEFICETNNDSTLSEIEESPVAEISVQEEKPAVPYSGSMSFTGAADAALKTVMNLLRDSEVSIHISWEFLSSQENKMAVV